jgi:hypothetical protein
MDEIDLEMTEYEICDDVVAAEVVPKKEYHMHDRNGRPLAVGDKVNVPCTIKECGDAGTEYCNLTVVTDIPMAERTVGDVIILNAHMVEKVTTEDEE